MQNLDVIATELFNKIRGRFPTVTLGNEESNVTSEPAQARYFDFDFMSEGRPVGKISISLEDSHLAIVYGKDLMTNENDITKGNWYEFLKELRMFAKKRMMSFDTRDITKSNLDTRDYKFLANNRSGEQTMSESKLYGTSTRSYQNIGTARMVLRHSQPVNQEQAAGRSQHVDSIYIESTEGERFKYPFKHINGARAMARHVSEGGKPFDDFGKHITSLSEELYKLRKFKSYMNRSSVMAESLSGYMDVVNERILSVKKTVEGLQKQSHYTEAVQTFEATVLEEVPADVAENWIDQLTIKQFNEELKDVFPYIYKLVSEATHAKEITPEDMIDEGSMKDIMHADAERMSREQFVEKYGDENGEFWDNIMGDLDEGDDPNLAKAYRMGNAAFKAGNKDALETIPKQYRDMWIKGWNDGEKFAGEMSETEKQKGVDGKACWKGYKRMGTKMKGGKRVDNCVPEELELESMFDSLLGQFAEADDGAKKSDIPAYKRKAQGDKDWKVTTKDLEKEKERNISSAEWLRKQREAADGQDDTMDVKINSKGQLSKMDSPEVEEEKTPLSEFILSYFDRETGQFPKGETAVLTMIEKDYGEQYIEPAKQFIEKISNLVAEVMGYRETDMSEEGTAHNFKKGDLVRFKGQDEEFEIAGLAAQSDDPNTVYIRKPGTTPTQGAVASSLELAKGAQVAQSKPAPKFKEGDTVEYKGEIYKVYGVDKDAPDTLYLQKPGETRTMGVWAGGGDVKLTQSETSSDMARIRELAGLR
jgi:hypothetical protein